MRNFELKGWMGPIVGPIIGAIVALRVAARHDWDWDGLIDIYDWILAFAGIGLLAGLLMWLTDVSRNRRKKSTQ